MRALDARIRKTVRLTSLVLVAAPARARSPSRRVCLAPQLALRTDSPAMLEALEALEALGGRSEVSASLAFVSCLSSS